MTTQEKIDRLNKLYSDNYDNLIQKATKFCKGNKELAEDIIGDAFINCHNQIIKNNLEEDANSNGYLGYISRSAYYNFTLLKKRENKRAEIDAYIQNNWNSTYYDSYIDEITTVFFKYLETLNLDPVKISIYKVKTANKITITQVAEAFNVNKSTAAKYYNQIKKIAADYYKSCLLYTSRKLETTLINF